MTFVEFIGPYKQKEALQSIYIAYNGEEINNFLNNLKYVYGFNYLVDIFAIDFSQENDENIKNRFGLNFQVRNLETNIDLFIKYYTDGKIDEDKITAWENCEWYCREVYDLFGIKPFFTPLRLLNTSNYKGHPFLKDFVFQEEEIIEDNKNIEQVQNTTVVYNDRIKEHWKVFPAYYEGSNNFYKTLVDTYEFKLNRINFEVGYTHSGLEKSLENINPTSACNLIESIAPNSLNQSSILYSYAIEDLLGIEVSDRTQILRMMMLEFSRISEHLYSCINLFKIINSQIHLNMFINLKDRLHILCQRLSGHRYLYGLNTIGGLREDIPLGWSSDSIDFLNHALQIVKRIQESFGQNKFVSDLLNDKGINSRFAIELGLTGPLLRSTGINYDLRKIRPFYFYKDVDFEVPVGFEGKAYDLLMVKLFECIQSIKMILQLQDNLPAGKVNVFQKDKINESVEDLMRESKNSSRKEIFRSIEGSNGELGIYLYRSQNPNEYFTRVKIKTPSFANLAGMEKILVNYSLDKFRSYVSLINVQITEVDR